MVTNLVTRAFVGLVLASILVTGCSEADPASDPGSDPGSDSGGEPGHASTGASRPAEGAVGSAKCTLDREQLSFVVRDWGRVYGSIGRGDHSTYTGALVTKLSRIRAAAGRCKGSAELADFLVALRRIDARSRRPTPSYDLYDAASRSGNAWLAKMGYSDNALSVG